MLPISSETKISRFWDYPIEKVNVETVEEIKLIIELREQALAKVKNGEWTENEYEHFSGAMRMSEIKKNMVFYDVTKVLVEMPREDSEKELNHLINEHFFCPSIKNKSKIRDLAEMICFINGKLLSVACVPITEEEKNLGLSVSTNETLEEWLESYEQFLTELQNPDSEYLKVFKDFFATWVNKTFHNELLKNTILIQEDKLIQKKAQQIKRSIRKVQEIQNRKKDKSNSYFQEQSNRKNDEAAVRRK